MPDRQQPPIDVSYQLGSIQNALDMITRTLSENRQADATYRTEVRKELRETHDEVNRIRGDLTAAKDDIAEMRPTVAALKEGAQMSAGAQRLAILLGKCAQLLIGALGGVLAYFFSGWMHK